MSTASPNGARTALEDARLSLTGWLGRENMVVGVEARNFVVMERPRFTDHDTFWERLNEIPGDLVTLPPAQRGDLSAFDTPSLCRGAELLEARLEEVRREITRRGLDATDLSL